jgi:superfamily II DNA or RNA helicase
MTGLRQLQKDALSCLESTGFSTLVIMPTGSGKTRLIWALGTTKCTIIFAPYTILINQLRDEMIKKGATYVWPMQDETESMDQILCKAKHILIPYEAAQRCNWLLRGLERIDRLGLIFVDEVTCIKLQY